MNDEIFHALDKKFSAVPCANGALVVVTYKNGTVRPVIVVTDFISALPKSLPALDTAVIMAQTFNDALLLAQGLKPIHICPTQKTT